MDNTIHLVSDLFLFALIVAVLCLVLDTRVLVREYIKRLRKGW